MTNIHYTVICADNDKFVVEMVVTEKFKLSIFRKYRGVDQKYHKNYKTLGIFPIDSFPFLKGFFPTRKSTPSMFMSDVAVLCSFLERLCSACDEVPNLGLGP